MNTEIYDVCVLGLGYIGLPTASTFAARGLRVLGVDVIPEVIDTISSGRIHIQEPDLDILVNAAVQSGRMKVSLTPRPADVYIIAVPTPFTQTTGGTKEPDLSYVETAARSIAPVAPPGALIVLESTSPPGTTHAVKKWFEASRGPDPDLATFQFAHCPERILPGQMLNELVTNDRIVGGVTPEAATRAKCLYEKISSGRIFLTDAVTAEMTKLVENAFRDVNIAFANELSMICDDLKLDVWDVIRLANRHPRVNILSPGPGVGGHCIAVDPWFIVHKAGNRARLIRKAREVNDSKTDHVITLIRDASARFVRPRIACMGLTFKANVDDIRESPALSIVKRLAEERCGDITVADPHLGEVPHALRGMVTFEDWSAAVNNADIIVILVDHQVFKDIPTSVFENAVVIDTRGMLSSQRQHL